MKVPSVQFKCLVSSPKVPSVYPMQLVSTPICLVSTSKCLVSTPKYLVSTSSAQCLVPSAQCLPQVPSVQSKVPSVYLRCLVSSPQMPSVYPKVSNVYFQVPSVYKCLVSTSILLGNWQPALMPIFIKKTFSKKQAALKSIFFQKTSILSKTLYSDVIF